MYTTIFISILATAVVTNAMILPTSGDVHLERRRVVDPNAVTNTVCTAPGTAIDGHDINVSSFVRQFTSASVYTYTLER